MYKWIWKIPNLGSHSIKQKCDQREQVLF